MICAGCGEPIDRDYVRVEYVRLVDLGTGGSVREVWKADVYHAERTVSIGHRTPRACAYLVRAF